MISLEMMLSILDKYYRDRVMKDREIVETTLVDGNLIQKLDEVKYAVINRIDSIQTEQQKVMEIGVKQKVYEKSEWKQLKHLVRGKASYQWQQQGEIEALLEAIVVNNNVNTLSSNNTDTLFVQLASQLNFTLIHKDTEQVKFILEGRDN